MKNWLLTIVHLLCCLLVQSQSDITTMGELPEELNESSGLLLVGNRFVTHNDSGNSAMLYELDTTALTVSRTVEVLGVQNIDWEDLAQDATHIYIGDFGNNNGDREDLAILKIDKSEFLGNSQVTAERIAFAYEDQDDFTSAQQTDWDAEALFVQNDSLVVLTKQWVNQGTVAYKLPKTAGDHIAVRNDAYNVNGLVTGADFDANTNQLFLVGYSEFLAPFFVLIEDVQNNALFQGEKTKSNLSIGLAQVESLAFSNTEYLFATCEEFTRTNPSIDSPARAFRFSLDGEDETEEPPEEPELPEENPEKLRLARAFGSNQLNFEMNIEEPVFGMGIYDALGRRVSYWPLENMPEESIDISSLQPSIYYLGILLRYGFIARPFTKN